MRSRVNNSSQITQAQRSHLQANVDRCTERILVHAQRAKRKLGVENIHRIDFANLRGFKIIKMFLSFHSLEDRQRVAEFLERVS